VPGRSRPLFASIRPPHSRCLAPDPAPCLLAPDRPTAGAWHRSRPQFASIRPPHSRCLAPDPAPCLLASGCPQQVPGTDPEPSLLASAPTASGAWHQSRPQFASIRPHRIGCLAPDPDPMFASIRPPHSRCLAPDPEPSLLHPRNRHTWCGPETPLHRLATGGFGQGTGTRPLPNRSHRLPSGGQRRE
jgi:hypothetical protein